MSAIERDLHARHHRSGPTFGDEVIEGADGLPHEGGVACLHREIEVVGGVREAECAALLRTFFRELRSGVRPTSRARRLPGASSSLSQGT